MLKNKSTKKKVNKELLRRPDIYVAALSNKEELTQARSATTGEIFDTLDERIDHEVDRLNKKIDVTMLQQEDKENHVVENTVEGMTTDMVVKGRTLQNLVKYKLNNQKVGNPSLSATLCTNEMFKTNTTYTIIYTINSIESGTGKTTLNFSGGMSAPDIILNSSNLVGTHKQTFTLSTMPSVTHRNVSLYHLDRGTVKLFSDVLIIEGEVDFVPNYFEGIKSFGEAEQEGDKYKISILSSGKNFFKSYKSKSKGNTSIFNIENDNVTIGTNQSPSWTNASINYGKLKIGSKYTVSCEGFSGGVGDKVLFAVKKYKGRDEVGAYGDINKNSLSLTFTVVDDADIVLRFFVNNTTPINTPTSITYNNIQIVEGIKTNYAPSIIDKKDILLQNLGFDEGLRGLNNSVYDELNDIKNVAIKRVGKKIITSELPITLQSINVHGIANFAIPIDDLYKDRVGFCNKLILQDTLIADTITEGFTLSVGARGAFIRVKSEKASNVEEFKQYLATLNEPIVIYYPCEPVETPLDESIALKVFNEKTYVSFENAISGTSSFKAPVNTVDTIARLNRENRALEEENKTLRQDFESTTLSLTDSDLELVKQNVDMDFRLMEVEFALDIPQAILSSNIKFKNKKGEVKSMARTPYEMMKIVILSGDYDREDYIHKVGKYYERGRMTKEEHDELMSLMTADEVISKYKNSIK